MFFTDDMVISTEPQDVSWPRDCLFISYDFGGGGVIASDNKEITALRGTGTVCRLENDNSTGTQFIDNTYSKVVFQLESQPDLKCTSCCPSGFYCPETWLNVEPEVSMITCPKGYFCPDGMAEPTKCFFLQVCPREGMAKPDAVYSGIAVLAFLILLFGIVPLITEYIRLTVRAGARNKKTEAEMSYEHHHEQRLTHQEIQGTKENVLSHWMVLAREKNGNIYGLKPGIYLKMKLWATNAKMRVRLRGLNTEIFTKTVEPNRIPALLTFRNVCVFKKTETIKASSGDLKIEVKEEKHYYLNHATGFIRPGRLTAIMGPSGCGKSTLITALTNRVPRNMYSGEIYLNGDTIEPYQLNKVCGYVPQEDIMNSDLTVKENLHYICKLRHNPKSDLVSSNLRRKVVDEVIRNMGLHKVRHSIIGGGIKRGLSGGQKKRVNIAMELMHGPQILFMDEPTSGLDASMSLKFIQFMQQFAITTQVAVAMVIHQPNKKCFNIVDDVVLLQSSEEGGRVAYSGPIYPGIQYFNKICERKILPHENPADSFIDILSEGYPSSHLSGERISQKGSYSYSDVYDEEYVLSGKLWEMVGRGLTIPVEKFTASEDITALTDVHMKYRRSKPSWFSVAFTSGLMFLNTQLNNIWSIIIADSSVTFIVLILSTMGIDYIQLMFVINMLIGLVAGLYGVSIFSNIDLLNRYRNSGISNSATFFGTITASIPRLLFQNAVFNIPYKNINAPLIRGEYLVAITLLGQSSAYMVGMILCVAFEGKSAEVYSVILTLLFWTFSGLAPVASQLEGSVLGRAGMWTSYTAWMFRSEVVLNALYRAECGRAEHGTQLNSMGLLGDEYIAYANTTQDICLANSTYDSTTGQDLYVYVNGSANVHHPVMLNAWYDYQSASAQGVLLFLIFSGVAILCLSYRQFVRLTIAKLDARMWSLVEDIQNALSSVYGLGTAVIIKTGENHLGVTASKSGGIDDLMDDLADQDDVDMVIELDPDMEQEAQRISQAAKERRAHTRSLLVSNKSFCQDNIPESANWAVTEAALAADEALTKVSGGARDAAKAGEGKDDVISALHDKV